MIKKVRTEHSNTKQLTNYQRARNSLHQDIYRTAGAISAAKNFGQRLNFKSASNVAPLKSRKAHDFRKHFERPTHGTALRSYDRHERPQSASNSFCPQRLTKLSVSNDRLWQRRRISDGLSASPLSTLSNFARILQPLGHSKPVGRDATLVQNFRLAIAANRKPALGVVLVH